MYPAMLEAMRKQSRSVLIYVFFGIIIAVFVTTFSPSSEGVASCTAASSYVAKVSGRAITDSDFRYGFVLMGGAEAGRDEALLARIRAAVLDKLLERELMVLKAERSGLHVADQDIDDLITSGSIVALGAKQDAKAVFFNEGVFDYELFRRFCQYRLGQSVRDFKEQQRKELMAVRVQQMMHAAVKVSEEEVRADFEARGRQVDLGFVRFSPKKYAAEIEVAKEDVDGFLAKNKKEIEERYHTRKFLYTELPEQFRASHILVAVAKDAPEGEQEAQKARAEGMLAELRGGADFAAVAALGSDDERTKSRGGDLPWLARGQSGYGSAFDDAAFALKPGELSDLVRSETGWHIIRVAGHREGDLKIEDVEREIAEDLVRERRATDRARLEAEDYLKRLQSGEEWDTMFAEEPTEDTTDEAPIAPPVGPFRQSTGMFARRGTSIPKVGISDELAKDAFELTLADPLGKKPYVLSGGGVVLVKLINRQDPDMKDFEARKMEVMEDFRVAKYAMLQANLALQQCRSAQEAGDLRVSPAVAALGAIGEGAGSTYVPCATLALR